MLIDVDTGRSVDLIPYRTQFDTLRKRLSVDEFDAMLDRINELIDASGAEIATSAWLPAGDWAGTPFEPIYRKAAPGDSQRSAMFFGQLVWYTIMRRTDRWSSSRYELDDKQIRSRTYFRLSR
jgi:hypothetical protein